MAAPAIQNQSLSTGDVQAFQSLLGLVKNPTTSTSTTPNISAAGIQQLLSQIMGGSQGLASVASGQKASGLYNSSSNQLLINDLLTRTAGEVGKQTAGTTTTQKQNTALSGQNLLNSILAYSGGRILGPSLKKVGNPLDTLGTKLADSLGLGSSSSPAGAGAGASAGTAGMISAADAGLGAADTSMGAATLGAAAGESMLGAGAADAAMASYGAAGAGAGLGLAGAAGELGTAATAAEGAGLGDALATAAVAWVICTHYQQQGKLPTQLYLHSALRVLELSPTLMRGYHWWAIPLTQRLRKSPRLSAFVYPFVYQRCRYLSGDRWYRNLLGVFTVWPGELLCTLAGYLVPEQNWESLYG